MTGTAETEAAEFMSTYKLGVIPIPTNRPMIRKDQSDLVYKNETAKFAQVVEDIAERHASGQPVLVGTVSVEKSEYLSRLLAKKGVKHEVLNAKNHAREAEIVARAGRLGAVTVATNMAGRGTDIMLGGNAEFLAVQELKGKGLDPVETPEEYEVAWDERRGDEGRRRGGGREGHRGRRPLRARHRASRVPPHRQPAPWPFRTSGRPRGENAFYPSLTDDLMRRSSRGRPRGSSPATSRGRRADRVGARVPCGIRSAQSQVESRNAEMRKNVLKYDDVLNRQREAIYADRRHIPPGR